MKFVGQSASANRFKPQKGRVVALRSNSGTVHRVAKGRNSPCHAWRSVLRGNTVPKSWGPGIDPVTLKAA